MARAFRWTGPTDQSSELPPEPPEPLPEPPPELPPVLPVPPPEAPVLSVEPALPPVAPLPLVAPADVSLSLSVGRPISAQFGSLVPGAQFMERSDPVVTPPEEVWAT